VISLVNQANIYIKMLFVLQHATLLIKKQFMGLLQECFAIIRVGVISIGAILGVVGILVLFHTRNQPGTTINSAIIPAPLPQNLIFLKSSTNVLNPVRCLQLSTGQDLI